MSDSDDMSESEYHERCKTDISFESNMSDYSQISSATIDLEKCPFDLNEIIRYFKRKWL